MKKVYFPNPIVIGVGLTLMVVGIFCRPCFAFGVGAVSGEIVSCIRDTKAINKS